MRFPNRTSAHNVRVILKPAVSTKVWTICVSFKLDFSVSSEFSVSFPGRVTHRKNLLESYLQNSPDSCKQLKE